MSTRTTRLVRKLNGGAVGGVWGRVDGLHMWSNSRDGPHMCTCSMHACACVCVRVLVYVHTYVCVRVLVYVHTLCVRACTGVCTHVMCAYGLVLRTYSDCIGAGHPQAALASAGVRCCGRNCPLAQRTRPRPRLCSRWYGALLVFIIATHSFTVFSPTYLLFVPLFLSPACFCHDCWGIR